MLIKTGYLSLLHGCDFLSFNFDELLMNLRSERITPNTIAKWDTRARLDERELKAHVSRVH